MSEQASSLCHIRLAPHWDVISSFYIKHFVLHLETSTNVLKVKLMSHKVYFF